MFVNSDFSDLLNLFNRKGVRYLVIGGYAVIQYAGPRFTGDLDLWVSTESDNARVVYKALREYGAPLLNLTEADFSEEGYFYQMGVSPVRIDILMGIPGGEFEKAWSRRFEVNFGEITVPFISREDLIRVKLSSGRPQDLLDVSYLTQGDDPDHAENG